MILLLVAALSLTYSDYSLTASTDNDNEDFEEQNLIQVCCAWGEELQDGILTYKIDENDISDKEKAAVQDAVEEWDTKIDRLELEEKPGDSDITIEFANGNNDGEEEEGDIAGMTMTTFYDGSFIEGVEITINKKVQSYEFDAKTIGQVAKHEMGHALGLGHANFNNNLMAEKINHGTGFVSECEIKAVIEANYWKFGQDEEDNISTPYYPREDSVVCD
jgi:hypothetical protein